MRQKVLAVGNGETWYFDGSDWAEVQNAGTPGVNYGPVAFDAERGVAVLFGGVIGTTAQKDTWTFDGTKWSKVTSSGPEPRWNALLAWDPDTKKVVMVGGASFQQYARATWSWNGSSWSSQTTTGYPASPGAARMVWDAGRSRLVVFGGSTGASSAGDSQWEFDGTDWVENKVTPRPPPRYSQGMVWDAGRSRLVVFGGTADITPRNDLWTFDGTAWTEVLGEEPSQRYESAVGYDPVTNVLVMFGGYSGTGRNEFHRSDTWVWNGQSWQQRKTAHAPGENGYQSHVLLVDTKKNRLLFVGDGALIYEWKGGDWVLVSGNDPGTAPEHYGRAVAWDPERQNLVIFGGGDRYNTSLLFDDTWTWDGTTWTQYTGAVKPPKRKGAHLVFDPSTKHLVLLGGASDTWDWDGSAWTQRTAGALPGGRLSGLAVLDEETKRVVLYGGDNGTSTEEWDGATLKTVSVARSPTAVAALAGGWYPLRKHVVAFGGFGPSAESNELWEYDPAWTPPPPPDAGMTEMQPPVIPPDAGNGMADAGAGADGGSEEGGGSASGCGCSSTGSGLGGLFAAALVLLTLRRSARAA